MIEFVKQKNMFCNYERNSIIGLLYYFFLYYGIKYFNKNFHKTHAVGNNMFFSYSHIYIK